MTKSLYLLPGLFCALGACGEAIDRPISIPDFHATIACALGINPSEELYAGERPVPLTDHGEPIRELFG